MSEKEQSGSSEQDNSGLLSWEHGTTPGLVLHAAALSAEPGGERHRSSGCAPCQSPPGSWRERGGASHRHFHVPWAAAAQDPQRSGLFGRKMMGADSCDCRRDRGSIQSHGLQLGRGGALGISRRPSRLHADSVGLEEREYCAALQGLLTGCLSS